MLRTWRVRLSQNIVQQELVIWKVQEFLFFALTKFMGCHKILGKTKLRAHEVNDDGI